MLMSVTEVQPARWVDCSISDCFPDVYRKPSKVILHTMENVPVDSLPGASNKQYGHEDARGWARMSIRSACVLLHKRRVAVGDTVDVKPTGFFRNKEMRKMGTFRVYI